MIERSRFLGVVVVAALLALAGCSSGPDTIPAGSYAATLAGTHSELDGTWTVTLEAGGHYRIERGDKPAVDGTYELDGARVYFTDERGPMKCPSEISRGLYAWRVSGRQLTFTPVTDNCQGRRGILATQPLQQR